MDQATQSEYASIAKKVFVDYIQIDPGYNEELAYRYQLMKENNYPTFFNQISEPYIRKSPKLSRNDPCSCGSGKKYKKCCLKIESSRNL